MSEGSQQPRASRNARAERTTTSCGECRRRKQKCDQGQPCGNCLRRFPVPVCEYRIGNRIPGTSTFLTPARAGGRAPPHNAIPGVDSPLLQASQPQTAARHSSVSIAGWAVQGVTASHPTLSTESTTTDQLTGSTSLPDSQHVDGGNTAAVSPLSSSSWLQLVDPSSSRLDSDTSIASQQLLTSRIALPNLILEDRGINNKNNNCPSENDPILPSWSHTVQTRLHRPIGGQEEQYSHLPVAQTALNKRLLKIYFTVLSRFKASLNGEPDPSNPFVRYYAPFCLQDPLMMQIILYTSACFLHETGHVPETALRTCKGQAIQMLNQRLISGSGSGHGTGTHQGSNIIATAGGSGEGRPGDAAIAGVIQLTVAEWYWGESEEDLRYHLRGLRNMIRIRGGLDQLGMNGLLAKNAIVHDVSIALAHENSPLLLTLSSDDDRGGAGQGAAAPWGDYAFVDPIKDVPLRMAHASPLVRSLPLVGVLPTFVDCVESLGIHPATASILDNVRYLFSAVEAVYTANEQMTATTITATTAGTPTTTPTHASRKAQLTGTYMHEHISNLHPTIPGHRVQSPVLSTKGSSPPSSYFGVADEGSVRSGSISSTGTAGPGSVAPGRSPSIPGSDSTATSECPPPPPPDDSDCPTSPRSAQQQQNPAADYMYQAIRMTAIVYTRAIMTRTPLSDTCTGSEFLQIWTTTWRVPLSTWTGAVGIFHWIMLAIAPACHRTPHARFVKNMMTISTLTLGVENWAMVMGATRAGMLLQHWLKGQIVQEEHERGGKGGGKGTAAAAAAASAARGGRRQHEER